MKQAVRFAILLGIGSILAAGVNGQPGGQAEVTNPLVASPSPSVMNSSSKIPPSPTPQPADSLQLMLEMTWSAGPPLPFGAQDKRIGVIGHWMACAGGFCGGADQDWKPNTYIRGFFNDTYVLDMENPAKGWSRVWNYPGTPRQGMQAMAVKDAFYAWGGFSYTAPNTYKDGYKLSRGGDGIWRWTPLPDLPWPLAEGSTCAVGSKIYIMGGTDYSGERFYTHARRDGTVEGLGQRLLMFDTEKPDQPWREVSRCPGVHRAWPALGVIGGKIYVIGGDNYPPDKAEQYCAVDCWRYDPAADKWDRIRDTPLSGEIGVGSLVYRDRYILLPGACPRPVLGLDGKTGPIYGKFTRIDRSLWKNHPGFEDKIYNNQFHIYDAQTDLYGTVTDLPYDDGFSVTQVLGDTAWFFPGETGGFEWKGEYFGHHPEFVLKGQIREVNPSRSKP